VGRARAGRQTATPAVRVLVTGASSLLGGATVSALIANGHTVTCFQRSVSGLARPGATGIAEVQGDIVDAASVDGAMAGHDSVVHLAARVSPVGDWAAFEKANVIGTRNVVRAARQAGVTRIVHVSTPSVAPVGHGLIGARAEPAVVDGAANHYVRSKAISEIEALEANANAGLGSDLAVVAIRPHLVWGPGDTQLIGRIVARARAGRLALVGSGAALIDTTYIDNAADALVAALERIESVRGSALVVTNGEPRPVAEILHSICDAAGVEGPSRRVPVALAQAVGSAIDMVWSRTGRTDDPPMTRFLADELAHPHWFDQRETRARLGWFPAVSLDEGFVRLARAQARMSVPG